MRKKDFIGKKINYDELQQLADEITEADKTGEYDGGFRYTYAEIYLNDFQIDGNYDTKGRNAYCIMFSINEESKVDELLRLGHCFMCNHERSSEMLERFPHKSLEIQAESIMRRLIIE